MEINLKKEAIKNGLILALISVTIFLIINYAVPSLMGSMWLSILQKIIGLGLAIFFCLDLRKKAGGYWSFSEALLHITIMFLIWASIVYFFTIAFGKYIDTTYPTRMKEIVSTKTEEMMHKFGVEQDKIDKDMEEQEQRLERQFNPTFAQMIVAFGIQAIMYFVGALIFAAIFKKSNANPFAKFENKSQ